MRKTQIMVTGGLGYIGSHISLELGRNNYDVIIVDNREDNKILNILECKYYNMDIRSEQLEQIFDENDIDIVIHCAGSKSVPESVSDSLSYYDNNIGGTINLLKMMSKYECRKIIFSSSAAVYGNQKYPVKETAIIDMNKITSPYGKTKYMIEQILTDLYISFPSWSIVILRYFNPVGAHSEGILGENTTISTNLFPVLVETALGNRSELYIYGDCSRDYIHIDDLVSGHIITIKKLDSNNIFIYNLGTGKPIKTLDIVNRFSLVNDVFIKYKIKDRRIGDLPVIYADVSKIYQELGWTAKKTIDDMCKDTWSWSKSV